MSGSLCRGRGCRWGSRSWLACLPAQAAPSLPSPLLPRPTLWVPSAVATHAPGPLASRARHPLCRARAVAPAPCAAPAPHAAPRCACCAAGAGAPGGPGHEHCQRSGHRGCRGRDASGGRRLHQQHGCGLLVAGCLNAGPVLQLLGWLGLGVVAASVEPTAAAVQVPGWCRSYQFPSCACAGCARPRPRNLLTARRPRPSPRGQCLRHSKPRRCLNSGAAAIGQGPPVCCSSTPCTPRHSKNNALRPIRLLHPLRSWR